MDTSWHVGRKAWRYYRSPGRKECIKTARRGQRRTPAQKCRRQDSLHAESVEQDSPRQRPGIRVANHRQALIGRTGGTLGVLAGRAELAPGSSPRPARERGWGEGL